jgi:hypothetical protein
MAGSKRTFSYRLTPTPENTEGLLRRVEKILGWACDGDPHIICHGVQGEALGTVEISMTIVGRDQWWSRQLAQDVLNHVTWGLDTGATQLELQSHRQDAHQHRGYRYGRTKRYREPKPPAQRANTD